MEKLVGDTVICGCLVNYYIHMNKQSEWKSRGAVEYGRGINMEHEEM